jgi:hypothetical protein
VVGGASREVFDVGREEDTGNVVVVRFEVGYGHELGLFAVLKKMPDVDASLEIINTASSNAEKIYRVCTSA